LVADVIAEVSPDIVVHTAGISSLQECEKNQQLAYNTNVLGTANVTEAVLRCKAMPKLVFLSSDYVFHGDKGGYTEFADRLPKTFYGETKRQSEDDILARVENHLIVRTSNVYGGGGKFFMFLMDNLKRGKPVELYTNTFYTPTFLDYFTSTVLSLLRKKVQGIIHVAGQTRLSRYEFGVIACEALHANPDLVLKCEQLDSGLVAPDSSLASLHANSVFGTYSPSPAEAFQYLLGNKIFPYFEFSDARGLLRGLCRGGPWKEINYASSGKGTKRGGHWHRETFESFFIIKGRISVKTKDIVSGEEQTFIAAAGDFFSISPMKLHTFTMLDDVEWINLLSNPMDEVAPDIHTKN
jgi:dTDP-4-dehydrorhamnose reductase